MNQVERTNEIKTQLNSIVFEQMTWQCQYRDGTACFAYTLDDEVGQVVPCNPRNCILEVEYLYAPDN